MLLPLLADAQSFYSFGNNRKYIASFGLGTSSYFGELKNPGDYLDTRPTINLGLQFFANERISLRGELIYFSLKGTDALADDQARVNRNLSFTSNNFELSATGAFNIFPLLGSRYYQRPNINFYGFGGVGLMFMNPSATLDGKKHALQPLRTEEVRYSRFQPVIPYGFGVRIKASPLLNVVVESGWRVTFTDYMDDVSTVHPDKSGWTDPIRIALSDRRVEGNPELAPASVGAKRGNPEKNDNYYLLTLKVEYYLPGTFLSGDPYKKLYNTKRKAYYRRR